MSLVGDVIEYAKQVAALTANTRKNTDDIKALQEEVRRLSDTVKLLAFEIQRLRENEAHEREKMALRLEVHLLRRGIAPPPEENSGEGQ